MLRRDGPDMGGTVGKDHKDSSHPSAERSVKMGNEQAGENQEMFALTRIPNVSNEEAEVIRNRFKKRIATQLFVHEKTIKDVNLDSSRNVTNTFPLCMVVHVPEESAKKISEKDSIEVPAHYVVFSFGISWICGNELLARIPDMSFDDAIKFARIIQMDFVTMRAMQKNPDSNPFGPNESTQVVSWNFSDCSEVGEKGALIVLDPILRGLKYEQDLVQVNPPNREGPLFDQLDYIPQRFLCLHFLRPSEFNEVRAVTVKAYLNIVSSFNPCFISDPNRIHYLKDPTYGRMLEEARARCPAKHYLDGLTLDLVIRKNGRALDFVTTGQFMGPILLCIEQAFNKDPVPVGSSVGGEGSAGSVLFTFECHEEDGKPITSESAYFTIDILSLLEVKGGELVDSGVVKPSKQREFILMKPETLFERHKYMGVLGVKFYFPAEMLCSMTNDVRAALEGRKDQDWDSKPLYMSWEQLFRGVSPKCGFGEKWRNEEDGKDVEEKPYEFRIVCVGSKYFEGMQTMGDDGVVIEVEKKEVKQDDTNNVLPFGTGDCWNEGFDFSVQNQGDQFGGVNDFGLRNQNIQNQEGNSKEGENGFGFAPDFQFDFGGTGEKEGNGDHDNVVNQQIDKPDNEDDVFRF